MVSVVQSVSGGGVQDAYAPVAFHPAMAGTPRRNLTDGDTVGITATVVPPGDWTLAQRGRAYLDDPAPARRGELHAVRELEHPGAAELGQLLLQGHLPEEVLHPGLDAGRHRSPPSVDVRRRLDCRTTSSVGSVMWTAGCSGSPIRLISSRTDSKPNYWIDWSMVVSGGLQGVAAHEHQLGVDVDPRFAHGLTEAPLPLAGRLEVGPPGEEADAAVTQLDQVLGGGDSAAEVVGVHGGKARRAGVGIDRHQGTTVVDVDHDGGDQDDPVGERARSAWVRLGIATESGRGEVVVSFHSIGRQYRGVIGAVTVFFRRSETDDGGRQATDVTVLGDEPFQVNYKEDEPSVLTRFRARLEQNLVEGLDTWRRTE